MSDFGQRLDSWSGSDAPLAVLYRILGNDLPPRHGQRQTLQNLEFILEHEARHERLARGWILNRIFCSETEARIVERLSAAGESYLRLPFNLDAYAALSPDFSHFEAEDHAVLWSGEVPDGYRRILAHDHAFHTQNCYLMNVNGARNLAIEHGHARAPWVLPWDGNCFLTPDGWAAIRASCERADPDCHYLVVPMERLLDNVQLFAAGAQFQALEEPQIVIRWDAAERFDETLRYGRFSKVELLRRIGVPGIWDEWGFQTWEKRSWARSSQESGWRRSGWVARLASGRPDFDRDPSAAGIRHRSFARRASIRASVAQADRAVVSRALGRGTHFLDLDAMDRCKRGVTQTSELDGLLARAELALARPLATVLQKSCCAPNGDWLTYHSVAPFWWPDPAGDHLPYIRKDGRRVPEAELGRIESLAYDASRLQQLFEDVFALSWASYATDRAEFYQKAEAALHAWFCDERTGMRPHLDFAQVRRGRARIGGQPSGIIEARDIYLLLDGVALLRGLGRIKISTLHSFEHWCAEYLNWLLTSELGVAERVAVNNHGTCYEIQVLALASFLERYDTIAEATNRARSRVFQQFTEDGAQPEETARRTSLHYATFNLQSWMIVGKLLERCGLRLVSEGGIGAKRLGGAVAALVCQMARWREEIAAMELSPRQDVERLGLRLEPVLAGAAHLGLRPAMDADLWSSFSVWPHPYTGAPPLWRLAFPSAVMRAAGAARAQTAEIDA